MTALAVGLAALLGAGAAGGAVGGAPAETLLVARHDLARGVVLTAHDIDTLVVDGAAAGRPSRAVADAPVAPGWRTRRVVRGGEPLRAPAVAPPPLVARGATVTLVWESAALRLTRQGTALGDAHRGDRVTVRVDATRRFTGIATASGTVVVR